MGEKREGCFLDIVDVPQLTSSGFFLCFNEHSGVDGKESAGTFLELLVIAIYHWKILTYIGHFKYVILSDFEANKGIFLGISAMGLIILLIPNLVLQVVTMLERTQSTQLKSHFFLSDHRFQSNN